VVTTAAVVASLQIGYLTGIGIRHFLIFCTHESDARRFLCCFTAGAAVVRRRIGSLLLPRVRAAELALYRRRSQRFSPQLLGAQRTRLPQASVAASEPFRTSGGPIFRAAPR